MPVQKDPTTEGLLNITNLYLDRKQAELDLERARFRENAVGRTIVPGVAAQIAQLEQKKQQQRERISNAAQQQGMSSQQMLPPLTPVTGQARQGGELGANLASGLVDRIGGGPKPAILAPGASGAAVVPTIVTGPQPGQQGMPAQTAQAGAPGTVVPIQQDLSGWQRALSGFGTALSLAGRNPEGFVRLGSEVATGKRTIGYEKLPTLEEQNAQLAQPLSVLRARMASPNPAVAQQAGQRYQQGLDQLEQAFGPERRATIELQAEDQYYAADEAFRRRFEDPTETAKRDKAVAEWNIEKKVIESGKKPEEVLNPGELAILQGRQTKAAQVTVQNITKPTATSLESGIKGSSDLINKLNVIDEATTNPDGSFWNEPFTIGGKARHKALELRAQGFGPPLSPQEGAELQRFADVDTTMASMTLEQLHSWLGATMSEGELKASEPLLPKPWKDAFTNQQDLLRLRENAGLSIMRYEQILQSNSLADPRYAEELSDTKTYARGVADKAVKDLMSTGVPQDQAYQQVKEQFRRRYGLDLNRLVGAKK